MRYGFKAQSERISAKCRADLGLALSDPFPAKQFLENHGVIVWYPQQVPNLSTASLTQLVNADPSSWSGVTVKGYGKTVVIVNSQHSIARQANTLMHEWAHIHLRHKPKRVDISEDGILLISDYEKEDENEADWLAGAMLVPREGLLSLLKARSTISQIAENFTVSSELAEWRIRMTGVKKQLAFV